MNVADLISILQQQDPGAIAVIPSPEGYSNPLDVLKVEPRDVTPTWLVGRDKPGLGNLRIADSDAPGAMPGLYLGDTNAVPTLVTGARIGRNESWDNFLAGPRACDDFMREDDK